MTRWIFSFACVLSRSTRRPTTGVSAKVAAISGLKERSQRHETLWYRSWIEARGFFSRPLMLGVDRGVSRVRYGTRRGLVTQL